LRKIGISPERQRQNCQHITVWRNGGGVEVQRYDRRLILPPATAPSGQPVARKQADSTAVQKENIPERKYIKMAKYRLEEFFSYISSINFEDNFYLSVCNSKFNVNLYPFFNLLIE